MQEETLKILKVSGHREDLSIVLHLTRDFAFIAIYVRY